MSIYNRIKALVPVKVKDWLKAKFRSSFLDALRRKTHPKKIRRIYIQSAIKKGENFLKLHLGCGNKRFPGYINLDYRLTRATDYVCDCTSLPFPDASVELIETYHMLEHLPKSKVADALADWWRVLIPGGRLIIECPDFDQTVTEYLKGDEKRLDNIFGLQRFDGDTHLTGYNFERLKKLLEKTGFKGVKRCAPQDYHRLLEPCMRIVAYKSIDTLLTVSSDEEWLEREKTRPETLTIDWRRKHIHTTILTELEEELFAGKKTISFGCGTGELENIFAHKGHAITGVDISGEAIKIAEKHKREEYLGNVEFVCASLSQLPFPDDAFDAGYAIEVLEHIEPELYDEIFSEIKRVVKPGGKIFITVPNKGEYNGREHRNLFTKGTLVELFDKQNLSIDWVDLEERSDAYRKHSLLKAMLTNTPAVTATRKRRICAIGGYDLYRYTQLGFHWDGQARAFAELGFDATCVDIRKDTNYESLKEKVLASKPDILWMGLKECIPFIQWMRDDIIGLRKRGCKVVYWYCDIREPELIDLSELIDVMFISNTGQIEAYRRAYNIDEVHYMPQGCTPAFMHRIAVPEEHDVAFAGSISRTWHNKRARLLKKLANRFDLATSNNVRNTIVSFYSKSKLAFGSNARIIKELYTSNRFFVAIGCGTCYVCEWFPGIEKLVENGTHVVWFKDTEELMDLMRKYLDDDDTRNAIRKNVQELAHNKHTYTQRVQNMFDIIDGKTDRFYGFLQGGSR